jgi:predicted RNA-binding Zn ribbon-like protein
MFVGERLCVDFVNTELVEDGVRVDRLRGFDDLVEWCAQAQVIGTADAKGILRRWSRRPEAIEAHRRAIAFRGVLRRMLEGLAGGRAQVSAHALDAINGLLRDDTRQREVVRTKAGYETRTRRRIEAPGDLLGAIAESAADLLSTDDLTLLRACQNPECVLFFYDTTKNHRRRWCSMAACGNRAKVAAHYRRGRQPTASA